MKTQLHNLSSLYDPIINFNNIVQKYGDNGLAYTKIIDPNNVSVATLFGDGATATIIANEKHTESIGEFDCPTKLILGTSVLLPLRGLIKIFLSEFAISV